MSALMLKHYGNSLFPIEFLTEIETLFAADIKIIGMSDTPAQTLFEQPRKQPKGNHIFAMPCLKSHGVRKRKKKLKTQKTRKL